MLKAIKVRLYPAVDQEIYLGKLFGCSRLVYNKCLDFKITEYKEAGCVLSVAKATTVTSTQQTISNKKS
jgi:transposase